MCTEVDPVKYSSSKYTTPPFRCLEGAKTFYIKVILQEFNAPERVSGHYPSKSYTGMVGLENLGATCYLNSLLQMLFHINAFRKAVYQLPFKDESNGSTYTLALQNVFRHLQLSDKEVNTQELLTAFGWTSQDAFAQQDVQEMMRILLDKLEEKMKGTVVDGAIQNLFCGTVRSYIKCVKVDYSSIREEEFYDIQLDVKGCRDIDDSFRKYIAKEMLDGDNQYDAGEYGKQVAEKGVIFTKFPPVLTLLLKRFDFDLQRMRFIKIHDQYKFTTRINLDAYLAEDVSRDEKSPNNYVLHSVLVHMGDVGGGHYYAYIRPSIGYSYDFSMTDVVNAWPRQQINIDSDNNQALNDSDQPHISYREKVARDGKWFKFNDDCVNEVRESEAVNLSYGKSADQGRNMLVSISSAYMLVYLRESEAKSIMSEVTIPSDLLNRLEQETRIRHAFLRHQERQHMYGMFLYATEDDVRNFRDYSRQEDFFHVNNLRRLKFIHKSSKTSVFWRLCKQFPHVPPMYIRLHDVYVGRKQSSICRVGMPYSIDDYRQNIDENDIYYIHINKVEIMHSAKEIIDLFHEIQALEDEWLNDLRMQLRNEFNFRGFIDENKDPLKNIEDGDLVDGCGLFCNNDPILTSILDHNVRKHFKFRIEDLQRRIVEVLMQIFDLQSLSHQEKDNFIAFIKVFDPYNLLPIESLDLSKPHEDNSRFPMAQSSYIPLKYLLSLNVTAETTIDFMMECIRSTIDELNDRLKIPTRDRPAFRKGNEQEKLFLSLNASGAGFDLVYNPEGDDGDDASSESSPNIIFNALSLVLDQRSYIMGRSAVFIIQLYPRSNRSGPVRLLLPFKSLNSPKDWLKFMANKKSFNIIPYTPFDLGIVIDAAKKKFSMHAAAISKSNESLPRKEVVKKINVSSMDNASSDSNSNSSSDPDIDSISDESSMDSFDVSSEQLNIGHSYAEFYPEMSLKEVADHVNRLLQCGSDVSSNRLVFYIISDKEHAIVNHPHVQHVRPMIGLNNKNLHTFLQERKLLSNQSPAPVSGNFTQFQMYYQILPFPLIVGERDLREHYKFLDITIVDHRIRLWRQRYLSRDDSNSEISPKRQRLESKYDTNHLEVKSFIDGKQSVLLPIQTDLTLSKVNGTSILDINEKDIIWPREEDTQRVDGPFLSDRRVMIQVRKRTTIGDVTDILRNVIGIPLNANAFEESSTDVSKLDVGSIETESTIEDISGLLRPLPLDSVDVENVISSKAETLNPQQTRSDHNRSRMYDVVSHTVDENEEKGYLLALLLLKEKMICDIYQPKLYAESLANCWCEANDTLWNVNHRKLAIQHIARADLVWMRGEHPSVRSTIVSVINFTLFGNGYEPIATNDENYSFAGPVLTYVRQYDDYETVCNRIAELLGESLEESAKYRLAVLYDKIPKFVSRDIGQDARPSPTPPNSFHNDLSDNSLNGSGGEEFVGPYANPHLTNSPFSSNMPIGPLSTHNGDLWSLLQEKYPHFTNFSYETAASQRYCVNCHLPRNSLVSVTLL